MSQDVYFMFNQPGWESLAYCLMLSCLAISVWKIRRVRATSDSVLAFLWSAKGRLYLTIIVLGCVAVILLAFRDYRGFWTLRIIDADRTELGYWFPRSDRIVYPHDIIELKLITIKSHSETEVAARHWAIRLATRAGTEYKSVDIYSESKLTEAVAALEQWTGLRHRRYSRHGFFGSLQPEAP